MCKERVPEGVEEFAEFLTKELDIELYDYQIAILKAIDEGKKLVYGRRGWMWV